MTALACGAVMLTGCQGEDRPVDRTPLPAVAAPPYICDYIPMRAVELMTGVRNPLVRGYFNLTSSGGLGDGTCGVYQRSGDRLKVLLVDLTPVRVPGEVEEDLRGASPLPAIVPGAIGYYFNGRHSENHAAYAVLARGTVELSVQLEMGVPGRDNAADVVALMKLIAPKLITAASAPSASPSASPSSKEG
ncbi:hypothetical protein [Planotetraspora sp. GP83]|uniref:hypothetical protein n=1 Tax=Planotetraspora sp. GP83 TaxID=3156264 RepID=UPI003516F394